MQSQSITGESLSRSQIGAAETEPPVYLSVVIPAYNESARLPETLNKISAHLSTKDWTWEVIVSDDGSTDGTADLVERDFPACRLLKAPCNRGKGAVVRSGMLAARGDYRLFTDADLSTPIEEIDAMLETMQRGGYDAVIASRAMPESHLEVRQPWWREWSGRLFNMIVRPLSGLRFFDTQCGFKLFEARAAQALFSLQKSDGWAFDVEILMLARSFRFRVREVGVRWINNEASKVQLLTAAPRMLRDVIAFRWRFRRGRMARTHPLDEKGPPEAAETLSSAESQNRPNGLHDA
jgi:dolichyl-phosphate beta-glucosyltransferase